MKFINITWSYHYKRLNQQTTQMPEKTNSTPTNVTRTLNSNERRDNGERYVTPPRKSRQTVYEPCPGAPIKKERK